MSELLTTLAQLPADSIIFVGVVNRDAQGEFFSYERSIDLISQHTQVPIYGCWDFYLGRGVVGGKMISGFTQGETAAKMALRIINGESADSLPILLDGPERYMFDYGQPKRFALSTSQLPAGSLVINQPISWYEHRKAWILSTLGLAGIVAMLMIVVHVRTSALRHAVAQHIQGERALQAARDELAQRVDELDRLNRITQAVKEDALQAKEEAEASQKVAEAASRAKDVFLANMSHELRTPLNGILGYAQLLQRDQALTAQQHDQVNVIERSGHHLLTLITDILDLAKIESGKIELMPTTIHLRSCVKELMDILTWKARDKGLEIGYDIGADVPEYLHADATRLRQILLNLLGNAVKFTEQGLVRLRISKVPAGDEFHAQPRDHATIHRLRFEISDTGPGIPIEQHAQIFLPFEQAATGRTHPGGTGLGLTISQHLVRIMGSQLCIQSRVGTGSLFWFEAEFPEVMPGDIDNHAPGHHLPARHVPHIIGYNGRSRKILIVDDAADNRAILNNALAPLGFEIFEAVDGEEALGLARTIHPDMVLLDLKLPTLTGFEVIQALRQEP